MSTNYTYMNKYQAAIAEIKRVQKRIKTTKKMLDKNDAILSQSVALLKEKGVRPYKKRMVPTGSRGTRKAVANHA